MSTSKWIRLAVAAAVFMACGALAQSTNPIPFINDPLVPTTVAPGGSGFTLTVNVQVSCKVRLSTGTVVGAPRRL